MAAVQIAPAVEYENLSYNNDLVKQFQTAVQVLADGLLGVAVMVAVDAARASASGAGGWQPIPVSA